jgi:glucan endo-1,3-alpha-glucosidase
MTTAPSTVTLNSQSFSVPAGLTKLSVPLSPGDAMHGTISRGGANVVDLRPECFTFDPNPHTYNFNAFVVSSDESFV